MLLLICLKIKERKGKVCREMAKNNFNTTLLNVEK